MPGAATHLLLVDEARNHAHGDAAVIVRDEPNYAAWGSIGPDFLFMYPGDWTIGEFFKLIFDIQDKLKDLIALNDQLRKQRPTSPTSSLAGSTGRDKEPFRYFEPRLSRYSSNT